jgi:hypothetical protein
MIKLTIFIFLNLASTIQTSSSCKLNKFIDSTKLDILNDVYIKLQGFTSFQDFDISNCHPWEFEPNASSLLYMYPSDRLILNNHLNLTDLVSTLNIDFARTSLDLRVNNLLGIDTNFQGSSTFIDEHGNPAYFHLTLSNSVFDLYQDGQLTGSVSSCERQSFNGSISLSTFQWLHLGKTVKLRTLCAYAFRFFAIN